MPMGEHSLVPPLFYLLVAVGWRRPFPSSLIFSFLNRGLSMNICNIWPRALFLDEWYEYMGDTMPSIDEQEANSIINEWLAESRMDTVHLTSKLQSMGIDKNTFAALIATRNAIRWTPDFTPTPFHHASPLMPRWCQIIKAIFQNWEQYNINQPTASCCAIHLFFERALARFAAAAEDMLKERLRVAGAATTIQERAWSDLRKNILDRLTAICGRSLILELNVATLTGQMQEKSHEMAMQWYSGQILAQRDSWWHLLQEYQMMARLIGTCIEQWLDAVVELLQRFTQDQGALCDAWPELPKTIQLTGLKGSISDPHHNGRTVWIIELDNGANDPFKITYKPRSLSIDETFNTLLRYVNRIIASSQYIGAADSLDEIQPSLDYTFPQFSEKMLDRNNTSLPTIFEGIQLYIPKILNRGAYGWMEYIERKECVTYDEIRRFYLRQGVYLALFYLLEATDIHFENLIAHGEYPVPIDLESLFHHHEHMSFQYSIAESAPPPTPSSPLVFGQTSAKSRALHILETSVLRTNLLPMWFHDSELSSYNMSGLGSITKVETPYPIPYLKSDHVHGIHVEYHRSQVHISGNMPSCDGHVIGAASYKNDIISGFRMAMELLLNHRDELLHPQGYIALFANANTRSVLRNTSLYSAILTDLTHPDYMRDALDRERFIDILWHTSHHHLRFIVPCEQYDLRLGDIPYFSSMPNSRYLFDSRKQRVEVICDSDMLTHVIQRIAMTDERIVEQQIKIIHAALAVSDARPIHVVGVEQQQNTRPQPARPNNAFTAEVALHLAKTIAQRIKDAAIYGADDIAWFGIGYTGREYWKLTVLEDDLYGGNAGIALFFAYLGHIAGDSSLIDFARKVFMPVKRTMSQYTAETSVGGGYMGLPSMLYAATHFSHLIDQPILTEDEMLRYITVIENGIPTDMEFDLVWGAAGIIGVLVNVYKLTGLERALDVAVKCGRHLYRYAKPVGAGIAWPTVGRTPLILFAHGTSGKAWALAQLVNAIADRPKYAEATDQFLQLIQGVLRYEHANYHEEKRNWPDVRDIEFGVSNPNRVAFSCTWCNGASGMAISRLAILHVLKHPNIRHEAEIAIDTSLDLLSQWNDTNHDLCHGALGILMAVAEANRVFKRADWHARHAELLNRVVHEIRTSGPKCGSGAGLETPTLMTGLAGIGLGLLYHGFPGRVPAVIALQ